MPRTKTTRSTLSSLVESDSDDIQLDESIGMPTPDSGAENKVASKSRVGKGRSGASKVTKTRAAPRRANGRSTVKSKDTGLTGTKRSKQSHLTDETDERTSSDATEIEQLNETERTEDSMVLDTTSGDELDRSRAAINESVSTTEEEAAHKEDDMDLDEAQNATGARETGRTFPETVKKTSGGKRGAVKRSRNDTVPETQTLEMEVEYLEDERVGKKIAPQSRFVNRTRPDYQSSLPRGRAGSASEAERSDPALRRKLGEITKKYENLDVKYRDLRELGVKEAERNFERLKKQGEERTKGNSNSRYLSFKTRAN